ncbi:MAG: GNAT family N-acetyltransferase [Gammaproteobacteria bacterium]|nr:GNAT family N-acetyltransferase [Gammaproteobacteria bacterium]
MNSDEVHIRPARQSDSEEIYSMLKQLAAETGDGDRFCCTVDDIREFGFGRHTLFHCLIASAQQQDLGLALYFPLFSTTRGRPGVYLQDLWISPGCRDWGVGLRMLREVIKAAGSQWQAGYLDLMVHGHNIGAERFYRRHGFIESAHDQHLTLKGEAFMRLVNNSEYSQGT